MAMRSEVYFVRAKGNEDPEALAAKAERVFLKIGLLEKIEPEAFVALKIHFGEKGNTGHIKPGWLRGVLGQVKAKTSRFFLTDSNTLYIGQRSNALDHLRLAWQHGFTPENLLGAPVVIADGLIGSEGKEIKVNLPKIKSAKIAKRYRQLGRPPLPDPHDRTSRHRHRRLDQESWDGVRGSGGQAGPACRASSPGELKGLPELRDLPRLLSASVHPPISGLRHHRR